MHNQSEHKLKQHHLTLDIFLSLPDPFISESCIKIKINLNFLFSYFFIVPKAFIKPFEATQKSVKIKIKLFFLFLRDRDGKGLRSIKNHSYWPLKILQDQKEHYSIYNTFHATSLFLYPLKTLANLLFSDVFSGV